MSLAEIAGYFGIFLFGLMVIALRVLSVVRDEAHQAADARTKETLELLKDQHNEMMHTLGKIEKNVSAIWAAQPDPVRYD